MSAFGITDEVAATAKEILRLVSDGAMKFHEIGVVARSLETYGPIIQDIFHQHRIPLAGTIEKPLTQSPLTKAVILLLNLPAKDFPRSQVIDLLSSPHFRFPSIVANAASVRPDLWDLATRELAICKGAAEWRRLRRYTHRDLELAQISNDEEPRKIRVLSAQMTALAHIIETLMADLMRLPERASWQEYTAAWKGLLEKYLGIAASGETAGDKGVQLDATILDILDQFAGLDISDHQITPGDFAHTFQHWLERSGVTEDRRQLDGVMVLNAAAARGLPFRALFVLAMNEGVFPRTIREDAFLRDYDRDVLERDLGYKVSQKLAAFDEEKLLFTLLVGAARERLYCSFQRADESGRALAPSWYIDELKRALENGGRGFETADIPRSIAEKAGVAPFDRQDLLLPKELAIRLTLEGRDPTTLVEAFSELPALYKEGRKVAIIVDQSADRLLPYDGALISFDDYWKHFSERGVSPTALETYARCPFQFFSRHVLGLQTLDRPEEVLGPSPAEFGELGHKILNLFYRALIEDGYFAGKTAKIDVETTLQAVAAQAFADYEENNPTGYPLAWEILKESIVQLLRQVVAQDLAELARSGFIPVSLETPVKARLPAGWPEPLKELAIRGRMDRIDRKEDALRVIDYKFKLGASPATQDKNLWRAALRGERLQPPLYHLLAQTWAEEQNKGNAPPAIEASFYFIAPRWLEGPLVSSVYGGADLAGNTGVQIRQTIAYLANGVRQGLFFIHRDEHCAYCEAATVCRKNHPPSLWRAENDPVTASHRALREKDLAEDEHEPD
ncbi:MAG TPA: PD-(D/E)XK nuclease family protein [Candidatus Binatia bacterium]|nr:PD-(D/E)XK nuclease family protein [Candidatus Binatia bacterium]